MKPDETAVAEDEPREQATTAAEDAPAASETETPAAETAPGTVAHAGYSETPDSRGAEQLLGRGWAILPEILLELAVNPVEFSADLEARRPRAQMQTVQPDAPQGSVAIIPLRGVITPRGSFFARLYGISSGLESFREDLREAVNNTSVKAIVIDIDSPGGTIDLVAETAAELYAARGSKPIVAIANTMCASAAYWIASQADEVIVTPSGQVGSIGVFTVHEDISAMAQRMGVKVTIIAAGKYKTEGNSYEPLSKQAEQATQSKCDELYAMFTGDIARGRGIPIQAVQAGYGEGRCVLSAQALALKMVDRIETFEQTVTRLGGTLSGEEPDGSVDPCEGDDDMGPDDDESPEASQTAGGSRTSAAAADYLSGEPRMRPGWQIGASRPSVGGRL